MEELIRTNDPVLLSWLQSVLAGENIDCVVFDQHTSIAEGSIGALQSRIMVSEADASRARWVMERAMAEVENGDD